MSKAFDTVDRSKLLSILEEFLNEDEIHLIFILTAKPKLKVKVGKEFGDLFDTTLGVMQGDCLSAILFILYLAKAMKKDVVEVIQYFEIEPKYADDITLVTTMKERQQAAKTTYGAKLAKFNLKENISKREEYTIPKPQPPPPPPTHKQLMKNKTTKNCWSDLDWLIMDPPKVKDNTPDWKRCKILGSLLDTKSDMDRRKILAIDAMRTLKKSFNSKLVSEEIKLRLFNTYVGSIFLYNSELWTLNKTLEDKVDSFHRRQLRFAIGIFWPRKISNEELYTRTKAKPWSKVIQKRRLKWLGHMMRLDSSTPARKSFNEVNTPVHRRRGRPTTRWIDVIKKDLSLANIVLSPNNIILTLQQLTENRRRWKDIIHQVCD